MSGRATTAACALAAALAACGSDPALDDADQAWASTVARWQTIAPITAAVVADVSAGTSCDAPIFEHAPDQVVATGSTFKLYVLAAVAELVADGRLAWDTPVTLDAGHLVPGRECTDIPTLPHCRGAGATMTVAELAAYMVKLSDNSATDHLLALVGGAPTIEALLGLLGHSAVARNQPLLATRQMFALKLFDWPALADAYLGEPTVAARRAFLDEELAALDPFDVWLTEGTAWVSTGPRAIDTIEWFSSPRDLCVGLLTLRAQLEADASGTLAEILTFEGADAQRIDPDVWPFVGFKGGSEPGVRSSAVLARHRSGRWIAVTMGFNDPDAMPDFDASVATEVLDVLPLVDAAL
ncbi:MAG: serine hydrolase [Kofleriaceae bacterium]